MVLYFAISSFSLLIILSLSSHNLALSRSSFWFSSCFWSTSTYLFSYMFVKSMTSLLFFSSISAFLILRFSAKLSLPATTLFISSRKFFNWFSYSNFISLFRSCEVLSSFISASRCDWRSLFSDRFSWRSDLYFRQSFFSLMFAVLSEFNSFSCSADVAVVLSEVCCNVSIAVWVDSSTGVPNKARDCSPVFSLIVFAESINSNRKSFLIGVPSKGSSKTDSCICLPIETSIWVGAGRGRSSIFDFVGSVVMLAFNRFASTLRKTSSWFFNAKFSSCSALYPASDWSKSTRKFPSISSYFSRTCDSTSALVVANAMTSFCKAWISFSRDLI